MVNEPRNAEQVDAEQRRTSSLRIGELLFRNAAVDPQQIQSALRQQEAGSRLPIGRLLIALGAIDEDTLTTTLAEQFGLPVVYPDREPCEPAALARLASEPAWELQALPIRHEGERLVVAVAEPPTPSLRSVLERCTGAPVIVALAPADALADAIQRFYAQPGPTDTATATSVVSHPERGPTGAHPDAAPEPPWPAPNGPPIEATTEALDFIPQDLATVGTGVGSPDPDLPAQEHAEHVNILTPTGEESDELPEDAVVAWLLARAVQLGATAIELQTECTGFVRVRFRLDSLFQHELRLPPTVGSTLVRRVMLAAALDPAMTSPQTGELQHRDLIGIIDAQITAVPTDAGSTLLLRLGTMTDAAPRLAACGVAPDTIATIRRTIRSRHGLVIVGARSGTDRTSLLRSLLIEANMQARSVVTIEEPGEEPLIGATQLRPNSKDRLDTALALDPDIIVLNRPTHTALVAHAVDAALSDRLVFLVLDTADPASALDRLRASAEPFLVAAAVTLIVTSHAQSDQTVGTQESENMPEDDMPTQPPCRPMIEIVIVSDPVRDAILHDTEVNERLDHRQF